MERLNDSEIFDKYLYDLELQGSVKKTIENFPLFRGKYVRPHNSTIIEQN